MDVNLSQCLVRQAQWGETVITNICSDSVTRIPWALGEWAMTGFFTVFGLLMVTFLFGVGPMIIRELFW